MFGPLLSFGFLRGHPASGRLASRLMNTFGCAAKRLDSNVGDHPDIGKAISCIDFQRGNHTRWHPVMNDGTGAPTLTDMGAREDHRRPSSQHPFSVTQTIHE